LQAQHRKITNLNDMFKKGYIFLFKTVCVMGLAYDIVLMIKTGNTTVHLILRSFIPYPEVKAFSELNIGTVISL
jgi:hypothetical protein